MSPTIVVGPTQLHSGAATSWRLVADEFIKDNLDGLVYLIMKTVPPFVSVHGIPQGGTLLARSLHRYCDKNSTTHLVVDDVCTTGDSLEGARATALAWRNYMAVRDVVGVCVFSRGLTPPWVRAVFQMPPALCADLKFPETTP